MIKGEKSEILSALEVLKNNGDNVSGVLSTSWHPVSAQKTAAIVGMGHLDGGAFTEPSL